MSQYTMNAGRAAVALGIAACALAGCNDCTTPPLRSAVPGTYQYVGLDSHNHPLVSGELHLTLDADSMHVGGTWTLSALDSASVSTIGPQIGEGELEGTLSGTQHDQLSLNLNPHYADNNVLLQGTLRCDAYTGTWQWDTIHGPATSGTFAAHHE